MRGTRGIPVLILLASWLASACSDTAPATVLEPQFSPGDHSSGAIIEVGEHRAAFGLLLRDADHGLLLYFRWDNGFCGAGVPAPTEFVLSTYRDVIRIDEAWRTLDKTEGFWFYVYPWAGTPASPGCNYLRTTTPLATGRGSRLLHDNDFFPFGPYGPGPGANAYVVKLRGTLTTAAGDQVQLIAQQHVLAGPDGAVRVWNTDILLSPDPRN